MLSLPPHHQNSLGVQGDTYPYGILPEIRLGPCDALRPRNHLGRNSWIQEYSSYIRFCPPVHKNGPARSAASSYETDEVGPPALNTRIQIPSDIS